MTRGKQIENSDKNIEAKLRLDLKSIRRRLLSEQVCQVKEE